MLPHGSHHESRFPMVAIQFPISHFPLSVGQRESSFFVIISWNKILSLQILFTLKSVIFSHSFSFLVAIAFFIEISFRQILCADPVQDCFIQFSFSVSKAFAGSIIPVPIASIRSLPEETIRGDTGRLDTDAEKGISSVTQSGPLFSHEGKEKEHEERIITDKKGILNLKEREAI